MLDIRNNTPFNVAIAPGIGKDGRDYAAVVIKGTFDIENQQANLPVSEIQAPINYTDEYYGEPETSSMKYELDTFLTKKGTDVVLNGHAYPDKQGGKTVDVGLLVGPVRKVVRVVGDRVWYKVLGAWKATDPQPFDRMPLMYERAFGGRDETHEDPAKHSFEPRNPVGTGFAVHGRKEQLEGMHIPNLEDPLKPIKSWRDKPQPAGFGFIGRHWAPRINYAGTYDEKWQEERCPFLPDDFDEFFYNGATPDLIARKYLQGGEDVKVLNASPDGNLVFKLPRRAFDITAWIKGEQSSHDSCLDTVVIEPDERRVILVWRSTIPCFREFLYIDRVQVEEKS